MSSSKKSPKMPKMPDPKELIALQAEYNRVGLNTPFGSQQYVTGPDGKSSTLVTEIGPEGRALVGRAMGLGMTDSTRQQVPEGLNTIAAAMMGRVGERFGLGNLGGVQLQGPNAMPPQMKQPPQPGQMPPPGGMPQFPGGMPGGVGPGGNMDANAPWLQWQRSWMQNGNGRRSGGFEP